MASEDEIWDDLQLEGNRHPLAWVLIQACRRHPMPCVVFSEHVRTCKVFFPQSFWESLATRVLCLRNGCWKSFWDSHLHMYSLQVFQISLQAHFTGMERNPPTHWKSRRSFFSSLFCVRAGLLAGSSSEVSDGCQPSSGPWLGNLPPLIKSAEMRRRAITQHLTEPHCLTQCCTGGMIALTSPCTFLVRCVPDWSTSERYIYIYVELYYILN